jgi:hypothetical protein
MMACENIELRLPAPSTHQPVHLPPNLNTLSRQFPIADAETCPQTGVKSCAVELTINWLEEKLHSRTLLARLDLDDGG